MTTFAEKNIVFPDGQLNVAPLPEAVMINGFTPETRDAPGMPLPAQYLNWLFRDIYRKASRLEEKTNTLNERVIPAWMPIACPMADAPAGYLKCNGAAFDKELYPELAMGYPSGKLPDLRGEFIRGWDDGRGVDTGRALMSLQAATKLPSIYTYAESVTSGVLVTPPINSYGGTYPYEVIASDYEGITTGAGAYFSTAKLTPNGSSGLSTFRVRPRNIAFLYIVRAA